MPAERKDRIAFVSPDQRQRQRDIKSAAREVDAEVADLIRLATRKAANQRDENRYAGGGGQEVLHAKPSIFVR